MPNDTVNSTDVLDRQTAPGDAEPADEPELIRRL
jgi:hypothetical protein